MQAKSWQFKFKAMFVLLSLSSLPPLLCCICSKCPTRLLGDGRASVWLGLLPWKPESTVRGKIIQEKKKRKEKKIQSKYQLSSQIHLLFNLLSRLAIHASLPLTPKRNSHIRTLSIHLYSIIYLHSYLKYFFYKRVYKLKIISLCPVTKWHLQGKGVCGTEVFHCIARACKKAAPNTV